LRLARGRRVYWAGVAAVEASVLVELRNREELRRPAVEEFIGPASPRSRPRSWSSCGIERSCAGPRSKSYWRRRHGRGLGPGRVREIERSCAGPRSKSLLGRRRRGRGLGPWFELRDREELRRARGRRVYWAGVAAVEASVLVECGNRERSCAGHSLERQKFASGSL